MKRFITVFVATLAAFAVSAASVSASSLPYGDTNPEHYSEVSVQYPTPCAGVVCSFSGTAHDYVLTFQAQGQPPVAYTCTEAELDYQIDLPHEWSTVIDDFRIVDVESNDPDCGTMLQERDWAICGYSPSGFQQSDDTEFWVRDDTTVQGSSTPTFGRISGEGDAHYVVVDSVVFDEQVLTEDAPLPPDSTYSVKLGGSVDFNGQGPGFAMDEFSTCSAFPELTS